MGLRLLFLVIVIALVVWLVRRALRQRTPAARHERHGQMVRCAHCGLHVPADEAVLEGDTPYCSEAHRLAGPGD